MHEKQVSLEDLMPLIRENLGAGQSVRFSPRGTSMLPMLRQGVDSVVLSPVPEALKKYDLPLYRRDNGQYVLHRIVKAGQACTCMGDNQLAPELGVTREQMIAVVTGFYRRNKFYPVAHPGYRLYCRVWHHSRPLRRILRGGKALLRRLLS